MTVRSAVRLGDWAEVEEIAIAIGGSANQLHVGILYRVDQGSLHLLDLAWHLWLRSGEPGEAYCWLPCAGLDEVSRQHLADSLFALYEANVGRIPYGIAFGAEEYFEDNLIFHGGGLTCATFVLAVFQRFGFRVADTQTWRARPQDTAWQEAIVAAMERSPSIPRNHIDQQRKLIGAASRFRPEEVAAAVHLFAQGGPPVPQSVAAPAGVLIKEAVLSYLDGSGVLDTDGDDSESSVETLDLERPGEGT